VVAGDKIDTPGDTLRPLLGLPGLHDVSSGLPEPERYTYLYRNQKNQIDYLLVFEPLRQTLRSVSIERRGMHKVAGRLSMVTNEANPASDHAAIVAEFNLQWRKPPKAGGFAALLRLNGTRTCTGVYLRAERTVRRRQRAPLRLRSARGGQRYRRDRLRVRSAAAENPE